jgi:hypothetical protein
LRWKTVDLLHESEELFVDLLGNHPFVVTKAQRLSWCRAAVLRGNTIDWNFTLKHMNIRKNHCINSASPLVLLRKQFFLRKVMESCSRTQYAQQLLWHSSRDCMTLCVCISACCFFWPNSVFLSGVLSVGDLCWEFKAHVVSVLS